MKEQYIQSWLDYKTKDNRVRLIMSQIHRSIKSGQPYKLSPAEIETFNQAREAWFKFLQVARR